MAGSILLIYRNYSDSDTTLNSSHYANHPLPEFSVFGWDTPEGRIFKEYNTSRDGTGTSYAVGDTVYDEAPVLYLIWEEKYKRLDKTGLARVWAKMKAYVTSQISDITIPTKTSDLTNDSGFITGYTETDPTVPSWAKASTKPTYTAYEVGAVGLSNGYADDSQLLSAETLAKWQAILS